MTNWTQADVDRINTQRGAKTPAHLPPKRAKYGNQKIVVDEIVFDSKKEAQHYQLLKMRQRAGEIDSLEVHPVLEIYIDAHERGRIHIGNYTADFWYWEKTPNGAMFRVIDVKSAATRKLTDYQLRKKLVEALYNVTITEI